MPSRKAIYNSFIVSNYDYCPLVYYFTNRESINKMQKIQERALRFVLKDSVSDYNTLLTKCGVDPFRISSLKSMAVDIHEILNDTSLSICQYFPNLQFRILCEIMINWSNKKENDHLWNQVIFVLWRTFMEFATSRYKKCRDIFKTLVKNWQGPSCHCSVCQLIIWIRIFICHFIDFHQCVHHRICYFSVGLFQYTLDMSRLPYS